MKKISAILLSCILVFSLSACGNASAGEPKLTADDALEIALDRAGVSRQSITSLENNLDRENGVLVYEIDFDSGNTEFSYDVNAETGAIVESDRDRAD